MKGYLIWTFLFTFNPLTLHWEFHHATTFSFCLLIQLCVLHWWIFHVISHCCHYEVFDCRSVEFFYLFYIYICGPFLKIVLDSAFGPSPMPIPINRMSNEIEKHQECSRTPHHYLWNNIWLWPQVQVFAERSERICHCSGQLPSFLNDIFNKYRILVWQLFLLQHFQKVILFFFVF